MHLFLSQASLQTEKVPPADNIQCFLSVQQIQTEAMEHATIKKTFQLQVPQYCFQSHHSFFFEELSHRSTAEV